MNAFKRSELHLFAHLADPAHLQRYHPVFAPWIRTLQQTAPALRPVPGVDPVQASLQRLRDFMHRTPRVDRDYQVHHAGQALRLPPDAVPLDLELKVLQWALEIWSQRARPEPRHPIWDEVAEVLLELPPWVVFGGPATPVWYRCLLALYRVHPEAGERVLHGLFDLGRTTPDPGLALLARGALDFVRISLQKEGRA